MSHEVTDLDNQSQIFCDNPIAQVLELLNFTVVPRKPVETTQPTFSDNYPDAVNEREEGQCIANLFKRLDNGILLENKDKEIERLQRKVEDEMQLRVTTEGKLLKVLEFIGVFHSGCAKLINALYSLTSKSCAGTSFLNVGPFSSHLDRDEFYDKLGDLSTLLSSSTADDFVETVQSLQNCCNLLEKSKSETTSDPNQNHNSNKNYYSANGNENGDNVIVEHLSPAGEVLSSHVFNRPSNSPPPQSSRFEGNDIIAMSSSSSSSQLKVNARPLVSRKLPYSKPHHKSNRSHYWDTSKMDPSHFNCACGAKFPTSSFLELSTHIKKYGKAAQHHRQKEKKKMTNKKTQTSIGSVVLECSLCQECCFSHKDYQEHYWKVHNKSIGGNQQPNQQLIELA